MQNIFSEYKDTIIVVDLMNHQTTDLLACLELTCILPSAYKRKACEETVSHPSTHRYALYRM